MLFEQFATLLNERFSKSVYTTEDSIRYTFFTAVLDSGIYQHHELIMEYPHPAIPGAEVDTYIPATESRTGEVIEFKYHRQIPSGKNPPRPQKAGHLFKDIDRLQRFENGIEINRIFIYVTDGEMANYMDNKSNGLYDFFRLPEGERLNIGEQYINGKSDTFQKASGTKLDAVVECVLSRSLAAEH